MHPKVSVIVPAFNAEATISECLSSLAAQSLTDLEVLVIDDGSTDQTPSIASGMAQASPVAIRVIRQHNAGRAGARNRGVSEAQGEFIGFVDADDHASAEMYATLVGRAEATGADIVVCEYASFDADTGGTINHYREGDASVYGCSVRERPEILVTMGASVCNKLFRRILFAEGALTFPGNDFEDLATVFRLALGARRIEKVDEILYAYRLGHPSSIMSSCDERYMQIPAALEITNDYFRAQGAFESLQRELATINFIHLIHGRYDDLLTCATPGVRQAYVRAAFAHMDAYFPGWRRFPQLRSVSGRRSKHLVSTHRSLLTLYAGLRARVRPPGSGRP